MPADHPDINDNQAPGETFSASRSALFAPVLVNAAVWMALAAWAFFALGAASEVLSLSLIVLAVSSLGLTVHALARLRLICVTPMQAGLKVRSGISAASKAMLPWGLVRDVRLRRGLGGLVTRSGTLVVELATGQRLALADLARPDAALAAVQAGWQREETEVLEALGVKKRRALAGVDAGSERALRTG